MIKIMKKIIRTGLKSEMNEALLHSKLHNVFNRAIAIRFVDAGSCNMCELELQALNNPYYNLEGYGIHFVASPRHADILMITGPVSANMEKAVLKVYEAMPNPKWVIALGDCAECGGIFGESYASRGPVKNILPVDLAIPGCPPHPKDIIEGIVSVVGAHKH